jgi:hypothetical protein
MRHLSAPKSERCWELSRETSGVYLTNSWVFDPTKRSSSSFAGLPSFRLRTFVIQIDPAPGDHVFDFFPSVRELYESIQESPYLKPFCETAKRSGANSPDRHASAMPVVIVISMGKQFSSEVLSGRQWEIDAEHRGVRTHVPLHLQAKPTTAKQTHVWAKIGAPKSARCVVTISMSLFFIVHQVVRGFARRCGVIGGSLGHLSQ